MKKKFITTCMVSLFVFFGCNDDPSVNPEGFTELMVDINGSWKIDQVTQNGIDITNALDFQSFALELLYDGTTPSSFSLASNLPFVTKSLNGAWSFDDPVYPTLINFSDGTSAKLLDPLLSSGQEKLNLEVVLGCENIVYQYKLIK